MLIPWFGIGQTAEYYKELLETSENKKVQLMALDSLIRQTSETDRECFRNYRQQYIRLATELDHLEDAALKAIELQIFLETLHEDDRDLALLFNDILKQPEKIKDSLLLGNLYLHRSYISSKTNISLAIEDLNEALKYLPVSDTISRARAYLTRGNFQTKNDKYIPAYDDFNAAYRLFETAGEHDLMISAQHGITSMFSYNGFNEKAIEERNRLIQIAKAFNLNQYLAREHYNQAVDYRKLEEYDKSYEELLIAEKMANQFVADTETLIKIHSLFVTHYSFHKQLDEAKKHLDLLESFSYSPTDLHSEFHYLNGRIDYLIAILEFPKALTLAKKQLEISQDLDREKIMDARLNLARINYALKNYQESIENHQIAVSIKDSIFNKSKMNALAYFQTLYETEKKERELIEQATSFSLLQKDNESFKRAMLLGGIATILAFIVILLYRNHIFAENRRRLHELFSQKLLLSQEHERKRISENLHDGVGQQLLVIKNRMISSDDAEAKKLLDDAIEEIRYISRDLHPFLLKEFGITKAIEFTIQRIDENTKLFISSDIDNIDNLTSKENELNIYRIVQEGLSNVLKHAQADAVKISIKKFEDSINITLRDNGIGFDFNEKYEDSKSLGLKTLMERARVLNGKMKVTSKRNGGTILEFQISI